MGDQVEQMPEAVVTHEAGAARRLKETDWPRGSRRFRHLGAQERADAAARAAAQAEAAKKSEAENVAREAAELPRKTEELRQVEPQQQKQPGKPRNSVLPLKLRRKLKGNV